MSDFTKAIEFGHCATRAEVLELLKTCLSACEYPPQHKQAANLRRALDELLAVEARPRGAQSGSEGVKFYFGVAQKQSLK